MKQKTNKIMNQIDEIRMLIGKKMQPKHLAQIAKVLKVILLFVTGMFLGGLIEAGPGFDLVVGLIIGVAGIILAAHMEKEFASEASEK